MTVALTVYGQLSLKWRLNESGGLPATRQLRFVLRTVLDPWVLSGFAAALIAALTYMAAITNLELSVAYPFLATSFIFVTLLSAALLGEHVDSRQVLGVILIVGGLAVVSL